MADRVTPERRSFIMSKAGQKNTKPELALRRALRVEKASTHAPKREVKKVRKGTKREELLRALVAGATAAEIDALCVKKNGEPWSKSAAASARGVFWRGLGYGTRVDGNKYFVTLPKGVTLADCIVD